MQTQPRPSRAHPFLADAAGWGLAADHLAVIETEGVAMLLLLGSFGEAGPTPAPGLAALPGALVAGFQLDAGDLPGIGQRSLFAGQLRLVFAGTTVMSAEVLRLEWRSPATLFAEVPFSVGEDGAPVHDGAPARVAALVAAWVRGQAAAAVLGAAARSGGDAAVQAAVSAKDAAIRNNRAAQADGISPSARAHHLWWTAKREDEARRQAALAARLRQLQADLAGPAGSAMAG